MHAALDFTFEHPTVAAHWHKVSNTIVVLAARDELALSWLADDATETRIEHTRFREPDIGGSLTAVALAPTAARLVRKLPLALSALSNAHALISPTQGGSS